MKNACLVNLIYFYVSNMPVFLPNSIKNKNNVLKIWLVPTCFCYFALDFENYIL